MQLPAWQKFQSLLEDYLFDSCKSALLARTMAANKAEGSNQILLLVKSQTMYKAAK